MQLHRYIYALIIIISLASCTSPNIPSQIQPKTKQTVHSPLPDINLKNIKIVTGETIYVPVYSHIYYDDKQKTFNLAATLSVRNTDFSHPIIITAVSYYDSNGKLVKKYLERPLQLGAMASTEFVVNRTDTSGGIGANFIVDWIADQEVSQPVVEAVMIGTESTQGISFISSGRVIKTQKK